jgi:hypothetical protein
MPVYTKIKNVGDTKQVDFVNYIILIKLLWRYNLKALEN